MDMNKAFEELQDSEEHKKFLENEKGFELVHASLIREAGKPSKWEFGYYHEGRDRIVTFETSPVTRSVEQEAFKSEGTINTLDLSKVNISYLEAMNISENLRKQNYSSEQPIKFIAILQNLHKQLWNITLVTRSFCIINIKIDAYNGNILSETKHSILDLGIRKV